MAARGSATSTRSASFPSLFMFTRRTKGGYLLYKIDVVDMRMMNIRDAELFPLIDFKDGVLPSCECAFAFIEPYFYIIGEHQHEIFTIDKNDLLNIDPSQTTNRGTQLVQLRTQPMQGHKSNPLAFVYNQQLYVISKKGSSSPQHFYSFELYSPCHDTWTDLFPKPLWESCIKAHVIIATFVYFVMSNDTIMSFNLQTSRWSTVYDPYGVLYMYRNMFPQYIDPPPTFESNIQVFGNVIIGTSFHTRLPYFGIHASHLCEPNQKSFLRPTLDVSDNFKYATLEPPYPINFIIDSESRRYSRYMINHDGLVCLVFYGNSPSVGDSFTNHAAVTFFNISLDDSFNAAVSFNTNLHINNRRRKFTHGTICSCIFA